MSIEPVPIVILGGADRRPSALPEAGRDKHPLSGYKGVDVRIGDRPLIEILVGRLRQSGGFHPIYVAGPEAMYRELDLDCELIDTDEAFGGNIRNSMEHVRNAHPDSPVAFTTCDILPETEALKGLIDDFRASRPWDMWVPLVRAPRDPERLGAFGWKPRYRIVYEPGQPAVPVLPGHFVIVDPEALRLAFLYRLFDLGYRTRNRSIDYRRGVMVRGLVFDLLHQDLMNLFRFRLPNLTWTVLRAGLSAGRALRAGTITRERLEDAARKLIVRFRHRRRHPERRVLIPAVDSLSLARDIDTEEEARELGGEMRRGSA